MATGTSIKRADSLCTNLLRRNCLPHQFQSLRVIFQGGGDEHHDQDRVDARR